MRRIVSIWFPDFAVERFIRARRKKGASPPPEGAAFALVESGPKGLRLAAVNATSRRFGLSPGQRLADARAALPDLLTEKYEPEKDVASLIGLCRWLERYSPWVQIDGQDGALLDVTGVAHLFGGEQPMLDDMAQRLAEYGFVSRVSFGQTIGAAWALARYSPSPLAGEGPAKPGMRGRSTESNPQYMTRNTGPSSGTARHLLPQGEKENDLASLPIEALRIDAQAARTLRRLGLKTIGSLIALPRSSLARRFRGETIHENVLLRLDELQGHRHEPLNPLNPPSSFIAHRALMDPVITHEGLESILRGLCTTLARDLEAKGEGGLRLILKLFRTDGTRAQIPAALSAPSYDAPHILRLLTPKLDTLDAGFGIDAMTLEARETAAVERRQYGFEEDTGGKSLAELSDRVLNREDTEIAALEARESHVPEKSEILSRASGRGAPKGRRGASSRAESPSPSALRAATSPAGAGEDHRPLLILTPPEPARVIASVPDGPPMRLTWRRVTRKIVKSAGPERIAPEWWHLHEPARPRDYYVIEDDQGRRYWLYREGLYGEDAAPKWFVHGLTA